MRICKRIRKKAESCRFSRGYAIAGIVRAGADS